jgi:hypothetical protein
VLGWTGFGLVVGAAALTQAPAPISIDGNAITVTMIFGVALMTGKVLQRLAQLEKLAIRMAKRVFPEEYGNDEN